MSEIYSLVLWQPWASLMFIKKPDGLGFIKEAETRGFSRAYRGDLLICSAQKNNDSSQQETYARVSIFLPKDIRDKGFKWECKNHRAIKPISSKGLTGQGFKKLQLEDLNLEFI